jgi:hypothetical protein
MSITTDARSEAITVGIPQCVNARVAVLCARLSVLIPRAAVESWLLRHFLSPVCEAVCGVTTPKVKNCTFRFVAKTCRLLEANRNTFMQCEMRGFPASGGSLQ